MNQNNLIVLWMLEFLLDLTISYDFQQLYLENGQSFDFIVVGGGTGGCVVARRLAENGKHTVLVIQEGGVANDNLNIPALADNFQNYRYPSEMKYYFSVPQKNARLKFNGVTPFPIGKAIGGGSSVNGLVWSRGNPLDYDNWAQLLNDSSWHYENMLPFFRKSENYRGVNPTTQRGDGGPISIENHKEMKYGAAEFLKLVTFASLELGYPFGDANGPQTASASLVDYSSYRGRRVSAFSGYIGPLLSRNFNGMWGQKHNLIILLNTEAKRIIFEGDKAVGVTFISHNSSQPGFAKAKKEVILSAGVMDSPAILMRSGIGPKSVLDSANIPVVKYLEGVGKNLQDHVFTPYNLIFGNRSIGFIPSRELTPDAWEKYQTFGTGPYSLFMGAVAQNFFLSSFHSSPRKFWPDIHVSPLPVDSMLPEAKEDELSVTWLLFVTRNKSRGNLILDKSSIDNPPVIDFNFFDHPNDMRVMIDAIRLVNKICEETETMQSVGCRLPPIPLTACKDFQFRSDSYYECVVRHLSTSGAHSAGTCKMGTKDDPEAVVDSQLQVIGIKNLRIADASVMPVVTNANTQSPVYAIAERAADMILKQIDKEF